MYDIQKYVFDLVDSIKDIYNFETNIPEEKHTMFFHFFDDTIIYFTLITHYGMPFKILDIYHFEEQDGNNLDEDFIKDFTNKVNSLL